MARDKSKKTGQEKSENPENTVYHTVPEDENNYRNIPEGDAYHTIPDEETIYANVPGTSKENDATPAPAGQPSEEDMARTIETMVRNLKEQGMSPLEKKQDERIQVVIHTLRAIITDDKLPKKDKQQRLNSVANEVKTFASIDKEQRKSTNYPDLIALYYVSRGLSNLLASKNTSDATITQYFNILNDDAFKYIDPNISRLMNDGVALLLRPELNKRQSINESAAETKHASKRSSFFKRMSYKQADHEENASEKRTNSSSLFGKSHKKAKSTEPQEDVDKSQQASKSSLPKIIK